MPVRMRAALSWILEREHRLVLVLCMLALVSRGILALRTCAVSIDSIHYIRMAEAFTTDWSEGLRGPYHPGYPVLGVPMGALLGDFETSLYLVSVVLTAAALIPLYFLTKETLGRRIAAVGALLYALHPSLLDGQSEVLSEGAFTAFVLGAICLFWIALRKQNAWLVFPAGACAAAAYLTRPEAVLLLPVFLFTPLVLLVVRRPEGPPWKRLSVCGLGAIAVFFVCASPYLLWLRQETGAWTVSNKGSVQVATSELTGDELPEFKKRSEGAEDQTGMRERAGNFFSNLLRGIHVIYAPLFLLGAGVLVFSSERPFDFWYQLAYPVLMFGAVIFHTFISKMDVTSRYFEPSVSIAIPIAAAGIVWLWDRFPDRRVMALALPVLIVAGGAAYKIPEARRENIVSLVKAGRWIRENMGPGRRFVAPRPQVFYYAAARGKGSRTDVPSVREAQAKVDAEFLVVRDNKLDERTRQDYRRAGFELFSTLEYPEKYGGNVSIFRLSPLRMDGD